MAVEEIRYSYAGSDGGGKIEPKGIVVVTTGFAPAERAYYEGLQKRNVIDATTFPSGDQVGPTGQRTRQFADYRRGADVADACKDSADAGPHEDAGSSRNSAHL
jgi:hypothetical protein